MTNKLPPFISILTCLLLTLTLPAKTQVPCGMKAGFQQLIYESNVTSSFSEQSIDPSQRILSIHLHYVAGPDSSYSPLQSQMDVVLNDLNEDFKPSGISFRYCEIDTIPNYKYDQFSIATEVPEIKTLYYKAGVINLFLVNKIYLTNNIDTAEGHTTFPGGDDYILVTKSEVLKKGLAHQMGHFLGLYHTYETSFGAAPLSGVDCNTNGDLCCDTPVDIAVPSKENCDPMVLISDGTDVYHHPTDNMMSNHRHCRCIFTIQQFNRMIYTLDNTRSYLK